MLTEIDYLPHNILELKSHELHKVLAGPTLIHLTGRMDSSLFVSVLLHGNETTGWDSIRGLLKDYEAGGGNKVLPRNLSIFIGNIKAARNKQRRLDGQADFNRIWPGTTVMSPETTMMQQVVDIMRERNIFASIDIHNNTGINPHYACVNKIEVRFLRLALLFSKVVVHFTKPDGVQSLAFSEICPAVTIEAGRIGDVFGVKHAQQFVDDCLHLSEIPAMSLNHEEIGLYHTVAIVKVPKDISFGFDDEERMIKFNPELEKFNFRELPPGTLWGEIYGGDLLLEIAAEDGSIVTEQYFSNENGKLLNKVTIMPSMLTMDKKIIEQDCLCYLMESYSI